MNMMMTMIHYYRFYHKFVLVTYLLTYWRQFHFLFITLYISPASCSFMHLTTLVSVSVPLVLVSASQDLVGLGLTLPGLDLDRGLTVLWSH